MIYININGENPPEDWCRRAEELTEQLKKSANSEERKKIIDKNSKMWKELKEWLIKFSFEKCWYSEAKELVSDYHVDHFRPKNRAKQLNGDEREGYWWLAFDWKNYRISGSICNSPRCGAGGKTHGKADYFPLKNGCIPANSPDCDLDDELIYLLDPTDPDDPILLTFDESGYAKPSADEGTFRFKRAEVTIELLHLDFYRLVDERMKIWNKCNRLINMAQNLMGEESISSNMKLKETFKDIREMTSPCSELSATATACLLSSGNNWAKRLAYS